MLLLSLVFDIGIEARIVPSLWLLFYPVHDVAYPHEHLLRNQFHSKKGSFLKFLLPLGVGVVVLVLVVVDSRVKKKADLYYCCCLSFCTAWA